MSNKSQDDNVAVKDPDIGTKKDEKLKKPRMYKVVLHNDDFTDFEFVTELLCTVFRKAYEDARRITREVHESGSAIAGIYTYEIAETKVAQVLEASKHGDCPLIASAEPE